MKPRVLIAGIGNIFQGDDAFGVEVARRLLAGGSVTSAEVRDFGIRGIDLVFAFLDGYDLVVLVDAVSRCCDPGTVFVIEPDLSGFEESTPADIAAAMLDGHSLYPLQVLGQATRMGARFGKVIVVGCEPASIEENADLSPQVEAAIEPAISKIMFLVNEFFDNFVEAKKCVA